MDSIVKVQLDLQNSIKKGLANYKKSPRERITEEYVEARLENLERDWSLFKSNNTKLYEVSASEDLEKSSYVTREIYENTEDCYFMYKSTLKTVLNQFRSSKESKSKSKADDSDKPSALLRLPKITIPTFSGSYAEWTTFRDLFVSLVHNNDSLENVQKLHYLKTHLSGEAAQLIKHTPITDANYGQCWSLLEKRYNNKKYLANCILKRLFGQRRIAVESASGLKDLLDTTMDCMSALKNINVDVSTWDIIIIHIVTFKFDTETRKEWELHIANFFDTNDLPTLDQLKCFMESRFRALEFVEPKKFSGHQNSVTSVKPRALLATNVSSLRCEFCSESHKLCFCKKFAKQECAQRRDFVAKNSICFNCLGSNHTVYQCKKPTSCRICKRRHHSLLHPEYDRATSATSLTTKETVESASSPATTDPIVSCLSTQKVTRVGQVLLATALVNIESGSGGKHIVRALLDQGSQACFITEAAVQLLRLKKSPVRGTITGLGGNKALISKYVVTIHLESRIDKEFNIQIKAYVLKNITSYLPGQKVESIDWLELQGLCLADPQFKSPSKIDLLLGANVYSQILKDGVKRNAMGTLIAQCTTLGWILSGTVNNENNHNSSIAVMHAQVKEDELLKRFWEIEEQTKSTQVLWTDEEKKCEDNFIKTTERSPDGRYIVTLPFRDNQPSCIGGRSRQIAITKWKALEKRLSKNSGLQKSYTEVIKEYLDLGHMRPVKDDDEEDQAVYLPHHAVVRNDKTTTKVRVVFNASSQNSFKVSLNDTLMIGPKLQADLRHLILRWRLHPIVLVADIVKMYRQVRIAEEHARFQRIVWREAPEKEIEDFELMTVTFGTACAPYLAVRALQQISADEGNNFPLAAPRVLDSFYMDDLMTGCSDSKSGVEMCKEITELLKKGGFKLQKWNSNSNELLKEITNMQDEKDTIDNLQDNKNNIQDTKDNIQDTKDNMKSNIQDTINNQILKGQANIKDKKKIEMKTENVTKILGITWDRCEDHFRYSVNLPMTTTGTETKRSILSVIARLYDPLGWIAPTIIIAKMFIQRLWLAGTSWDEPISGELKKEWHTYRDELSKLTSVQVPRWLRTSTTDAITELHGFCDASKLAYAAVIYVRVVDSAGNRLVSLLAAKTRVAPIKQVCIPRLELCGAVLLSQLLREIAEVLNIPKKNIKAWTDSTVVLAWLNSHSSRWKTFVANRVSMIQTTLDPSQWYHVTSKQNPADCASRGVQPGSLAENELWFSGPLFLKDQNIPYNKPKEVEVNLEEAVISNISTIIHDEDTMIERFSSLQKLLRVVAYCRRFFYRGFRNTNYLIKIEIDQALMCCVKKVQKKEFKEEYLQLQDQGFIKSKGNKLKSLCPYLDDNGIMRASGRIQKSQLAEDTKHPIILPHSSHFTKLIISNAHQVTLHGGIQLMVNYLRTMYWIIGVKNLAKQHIRECVTCVRQNAKVQNPFMGSLPTVRCTPARAFLNTGVDYAGPIQLRTTKGRGHHSHKGYICLFICMATRAIHLEVVSDMTTQAFLAAFRRFVSRRGHCAQLWSDNGTTFVGASKELQQLSSIQEAAAEHLEAHGTEWHFIPPRAPNFGGLWEAGVKSTKFHLKRVIGESTLTYEEMSTLLSQVEACLNSRPLTMNGSDPTDPLPLTPGHFLIGGPLITVPDVNYLESNVSSLSRWQFIQRMLQSFWRRWSHEYLSNLMNRYKWTNRLPEPSIGDIVLVKEDDLPPSRWLMGRIVKKHPGTDNVTRVVTIMVKKTMMKRPTSKLCVLPVSEEH